MEQVLHHYHKLRNRALGMFLLRLALGAIFIYAGGFKLLHMADIAPMFAMMHVPLWLTWIVALIEFIGGIMIIVGWWSKFFTGALFIIIVVAMILTHGVSLGDPMGSSHWLLLGSLACVFLSGCGRWSLCAWKHHRDCGMCKENGTCGCEHQ